MYRTLNVEDASLLLWQTFLHSPTAHYNAIKASHVSNKVFDVRIWTLLCFYKVSKGSSNSFHKYAVKLWRK